MGEEEGESQKGKRDEDMKRVIAVVGLALALMLGATRAEAVYCCCYVGNGQSCCGEASMCPGIIMGCFCRAYHTPSTGCLGYVEAP